LSSCEEGSPGSFTAVNSGDVRGCLEDAEVAAEDVPAEIQGLPALNSLVREAKRQRGAVQTPPPDPTFTGSLVAYFLLFRDAATARAAAAKGAAAVREFRERFSSSVSAGADYELTALSGNVLTLYLEDPAEAGDQADAIADCLAEGSR